ncbi:apicomplexan specific protein, putative [Babesia ovis]|uniref:Apicomplexan specific protein, putative n=1 Tax=Babesia ovis TaxID=5869 RepID=A0A9W5WV83_BABOV|nr:apicomplexan specific protein, putative [Babesia ovis]
MADEKPEHVANECYEALLDLKSIFPTWSDVQDNYLYHWREILAATTKGKEGGKNVIDFYKTVLKPLIDSKGEGIEAQDALEIITKLDNYRKEHDKNFATYNLEETLSKDTNAIRPKPPAKKQAVPRRAAAEVSPTVAQEGGHAYGTRTRSRKMMARDSEEAQGGKLEYSSAGFGTHLRKGFFSDYVWDFLVPTGEENEYDNEIDQEELVESDEEASPKRAKRSRK